MGTNEESLMKELKLRLEQPEFDAFADAAYARGRMKHQAALKEAVRLWLASDSATLSKVNPAKGLEIASPVPAKDFEVNQHRELPVAAQLSVEAQEWLALVLRALDIRDPYTRGLVEGAKLQLQNLIKVADDQGRGGGDLPEPGSSSATPDASGSGKGAGGPAFGRRKRA